MSSRRDWIPVARSSVSGANDSSMTASPAWRNDPGAGDPPSFPPNVVVEVKALACQLPHDHGRPLSRWTVPEIRREVLRQGVVAEISGTTLWRWLSQDAIRPWHHRSWIFPRDPHFAPKAERVLDLYAGCWDAAPLGPNDYVLSADEKTSIQARRRKHPTQPPQPDQPMRVEAEYERRGAWAYFAAWDVHRARIFGRCEPTTGIVPFYRLVDQVMSQEPYRSANRVFWIVDNGSSHRGQRSIRRLQQRWPNAILIHTPVHASWLNQIEIYFSIVQRKVLTPNDFQSLLDLEHRLLGFQDHYEQTARPFKWKFNRDDLHRLLAKLGAGSPKQEVAA